MLDEHRCHPAGGLSGDGEADAAGVGQHGGIDPDHSALDVEERAAGVAGVDGGVGLDDVADGEAVGRLDAALQRRDDAGGERAVEPERVADRDRGIADLDVLGRAEGERLEVYAVGVDFQQRQVARRVAADDPGGNGLLVGELDGDLHRAVDDVGVGEDVAGLVDDKAGAAGLAALLGRAQIEGRLAALDDLRAHERDAGGIALVDLARRQAARGLVVVAGGGADERGLLDDGRGLAPVAEAGHERGASGATDGSARESDGDEGLRIHAGQCASPR